MAANCSLINGPSAGCEDVAVPFHLQSEPYPCRRGGDGTTTRPHKQDPGFNSYATFLHSIAIPQETVAGTMSRRVAARLVLLPSQFFTLSSISFLTNSNVPDFPV